ncbi:MAG TPA: serine hydrolase domain-containing protein [Solirubrobacterales bacterium]|nr:serine hydrolase domain-containing protein [Solirubrobacterales bacterium]
MAATLVALGALLLPASGSATKPMKAGAVQRGLERLVHSEGGPPGAIATLHRPGRTIVLKAGRANAERRGRPRGGDHMRIASIAKAFNGAVALRLVQRGKLGLDDTIGEWLPELPAAWAGVTVRQMLNHTSGLPDYTLSKGFRDQTETDPRGFVSPTGIIDWVRADDLEFTPGSRYEYSNTDNIVVGLIAEQVTGESYRRLLSRLVFAPAGLEQTTFPTRRIALPRPYIHGYVMTPGQPPLDLTDFLSPSGAWASGAIVSTPRELGRFIRADLGRRFFGAMQQREQLTFVPGRSSPPGPGVNSAGLAIFRYKSRCGTVYGHTGDFPGYVQWAASTANGRRSVTTSLNIPAPTGDLLRELRAVQAKAVCALLRR